jgi:uncharacterized protein YcbK (DUF882 family)
MKNLFRTLGCLTFLLLVVSCAPTRDLSVAPSGDQGIVIWHRQSGERIAVTTRSNGQYNSDAFDKIDYIFRDRHTGEVYPIDPKLIDALAELRDKLMMSPSDPIELLSGYRSSESNANLSKRNKYVAKNSYHIKGQAADIRIPEMSSGALEAIAKTMQKGGVALYPDGGPDNGHVHVDTGPVRGWSVVRGSEPGFRSVSRPAPTLKGRVPVMQPPVDRSVKVKPLNSYDDLPQPVAPAVEHGHLPSVMPKAGVRAPPIKVIAPKASAKPPIKTPASVKTKAGVPIQTKPVQTKPSAIIKNAPVHATPHVKTLDEAKKQWVKTPYHAPAHKAPPHHAPGKPAAKKSNKTE